MRLRYLLVAAMLALGAPVLAADCAEWNTWEFFETATLAEVQACLDEVGIDVNVRGGDDWTPLHFAAWRSDDPAVIEALLEAGADVNAQNQDGRTPLNFAAQYNDNPAVIRSLLEAGADASARTESGRTPESYARARRAPRSIIVGLGMATGEAIDCRWWNTPEFFAWASVAGLEACLETGAEVDARTESGLTPLHFAASAGADPAVIRSLLEAGASLNARTESGLAPLHLAAVTAIPALLEAGADLNARTEAGHTPLHNAAAETDGLTAITALLEAGAN